MIRIQSRIWVGIFIFFQIITLSTTSNLLAQSGLQYTPEEIAIWRERAGLLPGNTMYKSRGDVSSNSPGDWDRIYEDALTAVKNSANDRFDNYDTSRGLNSPITELNSPWVPNRGWPARIPYIDAKEPRPGISGQDYAALSIMNAGFVYLLTNDKKFAEPVKRELLWYANNEWLDFSNTRRWVRGKGSFADRNPGFFIACWLNSLVNAYDYTKHANVYSASEREKIERWFYNALDFFRANLESDMSNVFNGYREYNYSQPCTGGWCDSQRGKPFEQSSYMSFGINEYFANRRAVMVRFVMRSALLLLDKYPTLAEKGVESAHRWIKEWIVYGNFSDGTYTDFHRGGGSNPEQGLQYTTIGLGGLLDAVDSYERRYAGKPGFQSLYEWKLEKGTADYNMYFPASVKARPWFRHFEVTKPRGLKLILETTLKHFDRSFGSSRTWSGQIIDGWEPNTRHYIKIVESERVISVANTYYKDANFASIYTRTKSGTRGYVGNPSRLGSYDINYGSWGGYPGILLMHGQLEGKVNPYNRIAARQEPTRILGMVDEVDFSQVKINTTSSKTITLTNTGNSKLTISTITSSNPLFIARYSGEIAPFSSVDIKVSFSPTTEGPQSTILTVNSDKTGGPNSLEVNGIGVLEITQPEITKLEAEASNFTVLSDVGNNGKVEVSQEISSLLSNDKAIKLYDVGDKVRYTFDVSERASYQINVRLRLGNAASPTAYWPNGYSFTLNDENLPMLGNIETVSNRDASFGTSYWGTMNSQVVTLDPGTHTLDIQAKLTWSLVDYIEISKLPGGQSFDEIYNPSYSIGKWYNFKSAAASITFDDNYTTQFTLAQPEMDKRNIDGTFFITTDFTNSKIWEMIRNADANGHEIAGHTISHPNLTSISEDQIRYQLGESKKIIEQNVPGVECITVAWPFGSENKTVRRIAKELDYMGARIAGGGTTSGKPLNEDGFFYRTRSYVIYNYTTITDFEKALKEAISKNGWITYLYHGIEGVGWKPISASTFKGQMEVLSNNNNNVWAGTFKDVSKYYQERESAKLELLKANSEFFAFNLTDNLDNSIFDHPLSIKVAIPPSIKAISGVYQNGKSIDYEYVNGTAYFNAIPDQGQIEILFGPKAKQTVTRVIETDGQIDLGEIDSGERIAFELPLKNTGNDTLVIESLVMEDESMQSDYAGKIAPQATVNVEAFFTPSEVGQHSSIIKINSNKTSGDSIITVNANVLQSTKLYSQKIEAEEYFNVKENAGNNDAVSVTEEASEMLSKNKAVKLYDVGDAVSIPFYIPENGKYSIFVRLRAGDRNKKSNYLTSGYEYAINENNVSFKPDMESISELDDNFGKSYWGTVYVTDYELDRGSHELSIKSLLNWALVDYIEIIGEVSADLQPEIAAIEPISFDSMYLNEASNAIISISNIGNWDLELTSLSSTSENIQFSSIDGLILKPNESKDLEVSFSPNNIGEYNEVLTLSSNIADVVIPVKATVLPVPLISKKIEAEENYTIANETGNKKGISVGSETSELLSAGKAVTLFDEGDAINISFDLEKESYYKIHIRARVGDRINKFSYTDGGYTFALNGAEQQFGINDKTLSTRDESFGITYWGTFSIGTQKLKTGKHTLQITSNRSWALIDYIEIEEIDESEAIGLLSEESNLRTVAGFDGDISTKVSIFPNPAVDEMRINIESTNFDFNAASLTIANSFGTVVYQDEIKSELDQLIDLSSFSRGVYFVQLAIDNETKVIRLLVE